jgi:hypothetical protein
MSDITAIAVLTFTVAASFVLALRIGESTIAVLLRTMNSSRASATVREAR